MLKEQLLTYRRREGISQLQLAERLGVSRQTIVRWEHGVNAPSNHELKKIADLIGITEQQLLFEEVIAKEKEPISSLEEIVNDISYGVTQQRKVLEDISDKQIDANDIDALKEQLSVNKEHLEVQKAILRQKRIKNVVLIILAIIIVLIVGMLVYGMAFYANETSGFGIERYNFEN